MNTAVAEAHLALLAARQRRAACDAEVVRLEEVLIDAALNAAAEPEPKNPSADTPPPVVGVLEELGNLLRDALSDKPRTRGPR